MKEKIIKAVIYICVAAVFFWLCFCSPYSLDDWFYGSARGVKYMREGWVGVNGRYLSNMMMMVFSRFYMCRSLFMGIVSFLVFWLIKKVASVSDNFALVPFAAFLFLMMSKDEFKSTMNWTPGFVNFTFSAMMVLLILFLMRDVFEKEPVHGPVRAAVMLLLGAATSLLIEHVSLYLCMAGVLLIIYTLIRWHKISIAHVTLLAGILAGTIIMFMNPMYRKAMSGDNTYKAIELSLIPMLKKAYTCAIDQILPNLLQRQTILNLFTAILAVLLVWRYYHTRNAGPVIRTILFLCMLINIGAFSYYYFANKNADFKILLSYSGYFELALAVLYYLAFAVLLLITVEDTGRRHRMLFELASQVLLSAPLLVASPVAARCFTPMYAFRVLLAAEMIDVLCHTQEDKMAEWQGMLLRFAAAGFITTGLCYLSLFSYIKAADTVRMSDMYAQIAEGKTVVQLEKLPYEDWIFHNGTPPQGKWMDMFKNHCGIPANIEIEITEFDGIH